MKRVRGLSKSGIQWNMKERLEVPDYVDDICLVSPEICDMEEKLNRLKEEEDLVRLHININKTNGDES